MKAVLDPNVLVSAVLTPRGTPGALVDFAEAEDVLTRPTFRKYVSRAAVSVYLFERLPSFASTSEDPEHVPTRVPADPKDDYLIALALSSKADLIVSGDGHLLDLEGEGLPTVLRPAEFLARLR